MACQPDAALLQSLPGLFEPLNSVLTSKIRSWWKWLFQSLFIREILVDLQLMEPKFPDCFTLKPTELTQSHLANTVELHRTLHTELVPVVDQVELGLASLASMSWGILESKWLDMSDLSTSTQKLP